MDLFVCFEFLKFRKFRFLNENIGFSVNLIAKIQEYWFRTRDHKKSGMDRPEDLWAKDLIKKGKSEESK